MGMFDQNGGRLPGASAGPLAGPASAMAGPQMPAPYQGFGGPALGAGGNPQAVMGGPALGGPGLITPPRYDVMGGGGMQAPALPGSAPLQGQLDAHRQGLIQANLGGGQGQVPQAIGQKPNVDPRMLAQALMARRGY